MVVMERQEARVRMHKLRTLRLEAALSQRELAAAAGVSEFTVQRMEAGHPAYPRTIRLVAAALGVKPVVLVTCGPPEKGAA